MKEWLLVLGLVGCGDPVDFDIDFDLGTGPAVGIEGNVTFNSVDGCPGGDFLFGCRAELPTFASGAHARFVIGSTTGAPDDEDMVERARPRSADPGIVQVSRSSDGLLLLDAVAPGVTRVDLYSGDDLVDSIDVAVEDIQQLVVTPHTSVQLVGPAFPVGVKAYGTVPGWPLYARGSLVATALDGLTLADGIVDYFTASDQLAVRADTALVGRVRVEAGGLASETSVRTITRDEISELEIGELIPTPNANKVRLFAVARSNGLTVDGGPACDWRIVSGGGAGAALSASVGDPFAATLFVIDNGAIAFGSGETIVECRANDRVVAQHTIQFAL